MKEIVTMKLSDLSIHDEALTTPRMTSEQYEALKIDIEENGQHDPVLIYRGKIVDGRHRFLILTELNKETISCVKMPNNSTLDDIRRTVRSKETRRHETPTQLAISAYRYINSSQKNITQADASKKFGISVKTIGFVKKISKEFKREDIIDFLFNGENINIGTDISPYYTDSLKAISNWLDESRANQTKSKIGIEARKELTEDENIMIAQVLTAIKNESKFLKEELASRLYSQIKEQN